MLCQLTERQLGYKVKLYEVGNSYITTKTLLPYFDVSMSSRDLDATADRRIKTRKN